MITDKYAIKAMHDDLRIAEDCVKSMLLETQNEKASETYLIEKADIARSCIDFVLRLAQAKNGGDEA